MEKRPGEFRPSYSNLTLSSFFLPSYTLFIFFAPFSAVLDNWILMVDLPDYRIILNCKASIENIPSL